MSALLSPEELERRLREVGEARYHDKQPFHARLHSGQCSKGEVQAWALNRFTYQAHIPVKEPGKSQTTRCFSGTCANSTE